MSNPLASLALQDAERPGIPRATKSSPVLGGGTFATYRPPSGKIALVAI